MLGMLSFRTGSIIGYVPGETKVLQSCIQNHPNSPGNYLGAKKPAPLQTGSKGWLWMMNLFLRQFEDVSNKIKHTQTTFIVRVCNLFHNKE
jgi:hypothetical protein